MVLHKYWRVIYKRLWIVVLLVILVALSYPLFYKRTPTSYHASMRFTVGITPEQTSASYYTYDRYYTWLTAEYLIDDLSEIVKSQAFAADVATESGLSVPAGAIQGSTATGKLHRILTLTISWPDREQLEVLSSAVVRVLAEKNSTYLRQLGSENAVITLIDPPNISTSGVSLRDRLDLPIRLILALVTGIIVAFLMDYLDTRLRNAADIRLLGVSLLAEIPRKRTVLGFLRRSRMP